MKEKFNDDFNYMPETLYFPKDKFIIENKFKNYSLDLNNLWLIKPKDKFGGRGISIFNSLKTIKLKEYILTNYITNINLIKNKKYDLRLYVLVSGLKPLRIYFNKEGLVRIASEKFSLNIDSIGNKYIHLTNTDINKNNKNYIFPVNNHDENSNIWNLKLYKLFLKKNNINWDELKEKIYEIFIKTIISFQQKLIEGIEELKLSDNNFYNLFGFDILITNSYDPILLEVNYSPCMDIYDNIDISIKNNLFVDTLNIVGITPFIQGQSNFKHKFKNQLDESINNAFCELNRPRGDFDLIFPTKENINKYKKYFRTISKENKLFWKKIKKLD